MDISKVILSLFRNSRYVSSSVLLYEMPEEARKMFVENSTIAIARSIGEKLLEDGAIEIKEEEIVLTREKVLTGTMKYISTDKFERALNKLHDS